MKRLSVIFVVIVSVWISGCAAPPQVSGITSYSDSKFNQSSIKQNRIAILPVVAGSGVEGYRRPFANALNDAARMTLPSTSFVEWRETMEVLNEADLVDQYQQAITAYASTSIISRSLVQLMSDALQADYFLYVQLQPPVRTSTAYYNAFSGSAIRENIGVTAIGQVWNKSGDVVWEGAGTSEVSSDSANLTYIAEEDKDLTAHSQRAAQALFNALISN